MLARDIALLTLISLFACILNNLKYGVLASALTGVLMVTVPDCVQLAQTVVIVTLL